MAYEDKLKMSALNAEMPSVPTPATHRLSQTEQFKQKNEDNPFAEDGEEEEDTNPFGSSDEEEDVEPWSLQEEKDSRWDAIFMDSGPTDGTLDAGPARTALMATGVPKKSLRKIWDLSDIDKDGKLDAEEFTVAMHLCDMVGNGEAVPEELETHMVPVRKRKKN